MDLNSVIQMVSCRNKGLNSNTLRKAIDNKVLNDIVKKGFSNE